MGPVSLLFTEWEGVSYTLVKETEYAIPIMFTGYSLGPLDYLLGSPGNPNIVVDDPGHFMIVIETGW